jgi:hypothetical protein
VRGGDGLAALRPNCDCSGSWRPLSIYWSLQRMRPVVPRALFGCVRTTSLLPIEPFCSGTERCALRRRSSLHSPTVQPRSDAAGLSSAFSGTNGTFGTFVLFVRGPERDKRDRDTKECPVCPGGCPASDIYGLLRAWTTAARSYYSLTAAAAGL